MTGPVTRAFTGAKYARVSGWELWPNRKSLDGMTWLCRWCAKPLTGNRTSYCSGACENELHVRATIPGIRDFAIKRADGRCEDCGVNLADLEVAFDGYRRWFSGIALKVKRGVQHSWDKGGWPVTPDEFREAAGYKSYGHVWEVNHKLAIAEGGDPCDPSNWEVLCLRCHRKHTKGVVGRLAKNRKAKPGTERAI